MTTKTLMKKTKAELVEMLQEMEGELWEKKLSLSERDERCSRQEEEIKTLRNRIMRLSMCYETLDGCNGIKTVKTHEREVYPEMFGKYIALGELKDEQIQELKDELIYDAAKALVENGIVQFYVHDKNEKDPLACRATLGMKMFFIPWEQMARKLKVRWRE